jgi:hypothetical protein
MNEKFNQWLDGCALAPGLLGGGVRRPDGTCVSHSFHENCPRERLEESLHCLADFLPSLATHGLSLGLAIQPNSPAAENLDLLTEEFFSLDLTD